MASDGEPDSIPFGKYVGVPIEDVPTDYLAWFIDNIDTDNRAYEIVEREFMKRKSRRDGD